MGQGPPGGYPPPPPGGYPPPPPGGYPAPPGGAPYDPHGAERALAAWATERGYTLTPQPDLRWYQGWQPFVYLPRPVRVGREVRATFGDAGLFLVEWFEDDAVKQAAGEDRQLVAFITSPRLAARGALRSKSGGGLVQEFSSGLNSLFAQRPAGSPLADTTLEARYDVSVGSREEGDRALPMGLRQLLVGAQHRGIVEVRPGGLLFVDFAVRTFDPPSLDAFIHRAGQVYQSVAG